jgi:hypothetical protein
MRDKYVLGNLPTRQRMHYNRGDKSEPTAVCKVARYRKAPQLGQLASCTL